MFFISLRKVTSECELCDVLGPEGSFPFEQKAIAKWLQWEQDLTLYFSSVSLVTAFIPWQRRNVFSSFRTVLACVLGGDYLYSSM